MTAVVYGVEIGNPTGVWHELKNAQMRIRDKGWIQGWFNPDDGSMCLANVLRFVVHGKKGEPNEFSGSDVLEAERLVYEVINKHAPEFEGRAEFGAAVATGRNPYVSIPDFNDRGRRVKSDILRALEIAADAVKPLAFRHSVTIASEAMTPEEREEINAAVRADYKIRWSYSWKNWRKSDKKTENPVVKQFHDWLGSFEERGWDTFWDELADCDTPECEEMRQELLGV